MSDIFNVEPPRWLQATDRGVDTQKLGSTLGEGVAAGMLALQRDPDVQDDPNTGQSPSWLQSRKGLFKGSNEAHLNLMDPAWRMKQAQMQASMSAQAVQHETQFQALQESKRESEATHQDIITNQKWLAASPEERDKMREQGLVPKWLSQTGVKWGMDVDRYDETYKSRLANNKVSQMAQSQMLEWARTSAGGNADAQAEMQKAGGPWTVDPTTGQRMINWKGVTAWNSKMNPDGTHPELEFGASKDVVAAASRKDVAESNNATKKSVAETNNRGALDRTKYKSDSDYQKAVDVAQLNGMVREDAIDAANRREQHRDETRLQLQENADNAKLVQEQYQAQLKFAQGKVKQAGDVALKTLEGLIKNRSAAITQRDTKLVSKMDEEIRNQERVLDKIATENDKVSLPAPPTTSSRRSSEAEEGDPRPWQKDNWTGGALEEPGMEQTIKKSQIPRLTEQSANALIKAAHAAVSQGKDPKAVLKKLNEALQDNGYRALPDNYFDRQ